MKDTNLKKADFIAKYGEEKYEELKALRRKRMSKYSYKTSKPKKKEKDETTLYVYNLSKTYDMETIDYENLEMLEYSRPHNGIDLNFYL